MQCPGARGLLRSVTTGALSEFNLIRLLGGLPTDETYLPTRSNFSPPLGWTPVTILRYVRQSNKTSTDWQIIFNTLQTMIAFISHSSSFPNLFLPVHISTHIKIIPNTLYRQSSSYNKYKNAKNLKRYIANKLMKTGMSFSFCIKKQYFHFCKIDLTAEFLSKILILPSGKDKFKLNWNTQKLNLV